MLWKRGSGRNLWFVQKNNLEYFINLGAGEGYHAIGSKVAKLFKYFFCYEIDESNQKTIKKFSTKWD